MSPGKRHESAKGIRGGPNAWDPNGFKRLVASPRALPSRLFPRPEEDRLLAAARAGDARAMRRLLTALSGPAYRFGRGFCRDRHDAEDVMQEVLIALARSLSRFRGEASLTSWAYVVARRVCMRRRRRRSGEGAHPMSLDAGPLAGSESGGLADPDADPLRRLERRELGRLLERAIVALPAPQREVLMLRDVEGLSAREVGKALRLGERAVKSRLHRARLALRSALAPYVAAPLRSASPSGATAPAARCAGTARLVSRYLEGEITATRCARLARHVQGCPDCGAACASLRDVLGACRAWGRSRLPPWLTDRVREAIRRAADDFSSVAPGKARA